MLATAGRLDRRAIHVLPDMLEGGDLTLLHAINYVQTRSFETFLSEAPQLLTEREKLFIVSNLYELMSSEGSFEIPCQHFLTGWMASLGVTAEDFAVFEAVLGIKNGHEVLGPFSASGLASAELTPHAVYAVSLWLTMTASRKVEPGHADEFRHALHHFSGLQAHALAYVKACDLDDFWVRSAHTVSLAQKNFILTHVMHLALRNGTLVAEKQKLLTQLRAAWQMPDDLFQLFMHTLSIQSIKPFTKDLRQQMPPRWMEVREKRSALLALPPSDKAHEGASPGLQWDRAMRNDTLSAPVTPISTAQALIPKESVSPTRQVKLPVSVLTDHHEKVAETVRAASTVTLSPEPQTAENRLRLADDKSALREADRPAPAGASLSRWWAAMESALSKSLGLAAPLQQAPRIRIPPIVQRHRIVDFSSIGVHLSYDNEASPDVAPGTDSAVTQQYSYKLKTCIAILKENIEGVNQKLNQLSPKQDAP
jgi:hypothetical protein